VAASTPPYTQSDTPTPASRHQMDDAGPSSKQPMTLSHKEEKELIVSL
jgi:hypothetical protein